MASELRARVMTSPVWAWIIASYFAATGVPAGAPVWGYSSSEPSMWPVSCRPGFCISWVPTWASQSLLEHAAPHASRAVLVRNGVDYEHFARVAARGHGTAVTIGYYGAIADWFDSDLVAGIARLRPQWRVVLIGSTWSADTAPLTAAS